MGAAGVTSGRPIAMMRIRLLNGDVLDLPEADALALLEAGEAWPVRASRSAQRESRAAAAVPERVEREQSSSSGLA